MTMNNRVLMALSLIVVALGGFFVGRATGEATACMHEFFQSAVEITKAAVSSVGSDQICRPGDVMEYGGLPPRGCIKVSDLNGGVYGWVAVDATNLHIGPR